jgi:hypothetical protein
VSFLDLIGPGKFIDPQVIQASAARGDEWYPYAAKMPLTPEAVSQPKGEKNTFILHTESGPYLTTLEALRTYLNRTDITGECTWILDMDGRCAQLVPVDTRADNNAKANPFATSVETQDVGYVADPGIAKTPWTDWQLAQLAGLSAWQVLHANPNITVPLRRADQGWDGGGIDGHYRYAEWSIYTGKTCPGLTRRSQIDDVLAGATHIVDWEPAPPPTPIPPTEDDCMATKLYLARSKTNTDHLRRGDRNVATVLRSNEAAALKGRMDSGSVVGTDYHRPETPTIDRPGERIVSWADIPELNEGQLDLDVGYVVVPTVVGQQGAQPDEG